MKTANRQLLSICIPAFGRLEYVRNTLNSIYSEKNISETCFSEYEVIVSDNDSNASLSVLKSEFDYPNFKYFNTNCEGFMNSFHVLEYGKGAFLKLHNSQELFNPGSLSNILNIIKSNVEKKPVLFFSGGLLKKGTNFRLDTFDNFMFEASYFSSWSNAFGIWNEDLDKIPQDFKINKLFPHTSLLVTQFNKIDFIILDSNYFSTQFVKKRGGHNKFQAFTIEYPSIIEEIYSQGIISETTKKKILSELLWEYLPLLFFNVKIARRENFSSDGFKTNIQHYFPQGSFFLVILLSVFVPFKVLWRKIVVKYKLKSEF